MSKSAGIRKEILFLVSIGEEIHIRKMARRYNCSPSLVLKNLYKVVKEKNLIYTSKLGRKGKVILTFRGEKFTGEHLNPVERMFTKKETKGEQLNRGDILLKKGEQLNGEQKEKEEKSFPYNPFKKEEKENNIFKEKLNAYEKRILSFYLNLGGRVRDGDLERVREINTHLTPSQFEAVTLKILREREGELPNLSYLLTVAKRLSLKTRRKKSKRGELFKRARANKNGKSFKREEVIISFKGKTGKEAIREFFGGI